jgi:transposase-like protein
MESRQEFVRLAEGGTVSVAELSRRFRISRQAGHSYLHRHRDGGAAGLEQYHHERRQPGDKIAR